MANMLSGCSIKAHDPLIHSIYCQPVSPANGRTLAGPNYCSLSSDLDQLGILLGPEEFSLPFLRVEAMCMAADLTGIINRESEMCLFFTLSPPDAVFSTETPFKLPSAAIQKRRYSEKKCRRIHHVQLIL